MALNGCRAGRAPAVPGTPAGGRFGTPIRRWVPLRGRMPRRRRRRRSRSARRFVQLGGSAGAGSGGRRAQGRQYVDEEPLQRVDRREHERAGSGCPRTWVHSALSTCSRPRASSATPPSPPFRRRASPGPAASSTASARRSRRCARTTTIAGSAAPLSFAVCSGVPPADAYRGFREMSEGLGAERPAPTASTA